MCHEISDGHFTACDKSCKACKETEHHEYAGNDLDHGCRRTKCTYRARSENWNAKKLLRAVQHKQKTDHDPNNSVNIFRISSKNPLHLVASLWCTNYIAIELILENLSVRLLLDPRASSIASISSIEKIASIDESLVDLVNWYFL